MQMSQKLLAAMQKQVNIERLNAALYDAQALALDALNWPGSSAWMADEAGDEREHSKKFADYIITRAPFGDDTRPEYTELPTPDVPLSEDLYSYFENAYNAEKENTTRIIALHKLAYDDGDFGACVFLQWFITEQESSERGLVDMLTELSRARGNIAALLELDEKYGEK